MKVTIEREFSTAEEAMAFLRRLETQTGGPVTAEVVEPEQPPAKKRGRKKEPEAQAPESASAVVDTVNRAVSQADAQAALEKVYETKGLPTARELLQRHGVERLKDLKPEQYAGFVTAAGEALK